GRQVQYFQRGRLEMHPEAPAAYRVQLGLLADELGHMFPPVREEQIPRSNTALHHYFPETQHVVSYAFLDYFRENGGIDVFGYPRSEFMHEAGRVVQYFQRAKMEWHPESPAGSRIRLGNLGEEYLRKFGTPPDCDQRDVRPRVREDALVTVAASSECRYFEETQHYVCDEFLEFFDTRGGPEIFGYPLTESFADPTRGQMLVQYFQRARMERHVSTDGTSDVQLGLLVDELGHVHPPIAAERIPPADDPERRYFPETGHVVEHVFLTYFQEKGGLTIFGYPRSSMTYEEGEVVQYFQRAQMVWNRADQAHAPIRLANVGEMYVDQFGIPGDFDRPVPPARLRLDGDSDSFDSAGGASLQGLKATASVRHPVIGAEETQVLYLYLHNRRYDPIAGAVATAFIRYPSEADTLVLPATDAQGLSQLSFVTRPSVPGQRVIIDIVVVYGGSTTRVQTFFVPSQ
ncbi:MAG: hypothetical protein ACOC7Y_01440, partial [Chloroflexota bacterium]